MRPRLLVVAALLHTHPAGRRGNKVVPIAAGVRMEPAVRLVGVEVRHLLRGPRRPDNVRPRRRGAAPALWRRSGRSGLLALNPWHRYPRTAVGTKLSACAIPHTSFSNDHSTPSSGL